jgi:spore germination cell wall hydrolase CwlJ-like protein
MDSLGVSEVSAPLVRAESRGKEDSGVVIVAVVRIEVA